MTTILVMLICAMFPSRYPAWQFHIPLPALCFFYSEYPGIELSIYPDATKIAQALVLTWSIALLVSTYFKGVSNLLYDEGALNIAWRKRRSCFGRVLKRSRGRLGESGTMWKKIVLGPALVALTALQATLRLLESFLWHVRLPSSSLSFSIEVPHLAAYKINDSHR